MRYHKDYKNWNILKKILDEIDIIVPFNEKEIWWCSLGLNIGIEIDGKGDNLERPVIIIKKLNREHAWVVPITCSGSKDYRYYVPVLHESLNPNSLVAVTQMQTISSRRLMTRIGIISSAQFMEIVKAIIHILPNTKKTQ